MVSSFFSFLTPFSSFTTFFSPPHFYSFLSYYIFPTSFPKGLSLSFLSLCSFSSFSPTRVLLYPSFYVNEVRLLFLLFYFSSLLYLSVFYLNFSLPRSFYYFSTSFSLYSILYDGKRNVDVQSLSFFSVLTLLSFLHRKLFVLFSSSFLSLCLSLFVSKYTQHKLSLFSSSSSLK